MPPTRIHASELPIAKILCDDYRFTIPRYQRPYAWEKDQALELIDDLLGAVAGSESLEVLDPYFLGSVVLVKVEGDPEAQIVDGQQRITTLTILLSILRELLPTEYAASLNARVFQSGDPIQGTKDEPRLTLRPLDQAFFEKHIQQAGEMEGLDALGRTLLSDSQQHLVENALALRDRLSELSVDRRIRLTRFVSHHTYLVIVATQDFESARSRLAAATGR